MSHLSRLLLATTCCSLLCAGLATPGMAQSLSFEAVAFPKTDAVKREVVSSPSVTIDGVKHAIGFHTLARSGDEFGGTVWGTLTDKGGNPILDTNGAPVVSDSPDFSSLLQVGDKLYSITHLESRPGGMYVSEVEQSADGQLKIVSTKPIDFSMTDGLWVPCAGSVTPWQTHLGSEEYPPNARQIEDATTISDISDYTKPMVRYFDVDPASMSLETFRQTFNPYAYGFPTEVSVSANGDVTPAKHYAMGRVAVELAYVMPDQKTAYISDDGTNVGLFRFVADEPGKLDAGTLFAAKWRQTNAEGSGTADLEWIDLGHATSAEVEKAIKSKVNFSDIFAVGARNSDGSCPTGFASANAEATPECLKVKPGMETLASRLETRRYASMMGATTEFRKMEGITFDPKSKTMFLSMSEISKGMEDAVKDNKYDLGGRNDVRLTANKCGAVYALQLDDNFVAQSMTGLVEGRPSNYAENSEYAGNTCDVEGIANPDNLTFMTGFDTLIIGEDTGSGHQNDAVWAYNLADKKLTRIETTPYGSETTSVYWYNDINGHGYLMSVVQHPYGESDEDKLNDPADARAYVGYIGPFPVVN